MTRPGRTGHAVVTYLVLAGLQRGMLLLILPFVTRVMPPAQYGAATMLTAAALLIVAIVAAPLETLVFRIVAKGEAKSGILRAAGLYCYLLLPLCAAAFAVAFFFVPTFLHVQGWIWSIEILAVGFLPAMSVFALSVLQAEQDLRRFIVLALSSICFIALSKFVLVVWMRLGVLGWVLSDLISAALSAAVATVLVRVPRTRVTNADIMEIIRFSGPLIPHKASFWAVNSLSRPALAVVSTLTQVGLLSFGLNLASVATLILSELNRAMLPRYSRETFRAPTTETYSPVVIQFLAAMIVPAFLGSGVAILGRLIFPESYWSSFSLTGVLLVAQAAYGLYLIPMNYLTQTAGLPKYTAIASGGGALIILVGILLIGRAQGARGVCYVTAGGYLAMAVIAFILVRAHRLDVRWRAWATHGPDLCLGIAALSCGAAALAMPVGSRLALVLASCAVVLVLATAALAGYLGRTTQPLGTR
ncbi:lipopolysaccharide biosynthesis protein [Mycobacterium kyogaense]|uniref:lipopolysaccharide biosynthesis protein n=1 Tax=Mycobacterium kyogaense TaxID=2212479 RepID=UPI003FA5F825